MSDRKIRMEGGCSDIVKMREVKVLGICYGYEYQVKGSGGEGKRGKV